MTTVSRREGAAKANAASDVSASAGAEKRSHETTDPRGRPLKIRRLTALDRMRLALIVGAEAAENASFMKYATLAYSVTAIDGAAVATNSLRELEAVVANLDEGGLSAVLTGWLDAGWIVLGSESDPTAEHEAAVKN